MTDQDAKIRAAIERQRAIRALPPHEGAVTITDPRYAIIGSGLRALWLWNCRKRGSYKIAASDLPHETVDSAIIQEAVMALHGPYATPIVGISKPDHAPEDWTMTFELPCDLRTYD